jgi:hypothetical protein
MMIKRDISAVQNDQVQLLASGDEILSTSVATCHIQACFLIHLKGWLEPQLNSSLVCCHSGDCPDVQDGEICLFNRDNEVT